MRTAVAMIDLVQLLRAPKSSPSNKQTRLLLHSKPN